MKPATRSMPRSGDSPALVVASLGLILVATIVLPLDLPDHIALYLPLHTAIEIGSSTVAFLIFAVGWLSYQRNPPAPIAVIAVTFFGVALLDIGHLLSYEGMPEMITPAGPEKAIEFWLAARLLGAFGLLIAVVVPWHERWTRPAVGWLLLAGVFLLVVAIFVIVLVFPGWLPATFDPETGLTSFKVAAELLVILIHLLTTVLLWQRRDSIPFIDPRALLTSILILILSEIFFTRYASATDSINLLGHAYKVIAYYYLFRAIIVSGIELPYRQLDSAQARLKATLEALPDIIFELDREGIVHQFHSRYPYLLARPDQVQDRCLYDFVPAEAKLQLVKLLDDIDRNGRSETYQYQLEFDGETRNYEAAGNLLRDPQTPAARYIVIIKDITQRKRLDHELRIAAAAFESQESICVTDGQHRILRVNSAFTRITGFADHEMVGRDPALLLPEEDREAFRRRIDRRMKHRSRWRGEVRMQRSNDEIHTQLLLVTAVRGEQGQARNFVYDYIDISALKKAETRIQQLALYDPLTGLGNRRLLEMRLGKAIEQGHEAGRFGGLLMINLIRFKRINDAMGLSAGDQLLIQIARELREIAGPEGDVFRQGADEFVLMVRSAGDSAKSAASHVRNVSDLIFARLNRAFIINGEDYYNRCRIGATVFGEPVTEGAEVLNQAAIAMHLVKAEPDRTFSFFDPDMQKAVTQEQTLESELRSAIENEQFILHYQPKFDHRNRVVGLEALIRWQHPERGLLAPAAFIPAAEKSGLITPIENWTLEHAILQLARLGEEEPCSSWTISVNVASSQFYRDEFESHLRKLIRQSGIRAERLILEFTESTLLHDVLAAGEKIRRLAAMGVRFSIDDFGTGYSSLAYLGRLPVHELKIDRSFVHDLDREDYNSAIVRMIIEMAHILGIQVVAEGVETDNQRRFLIEEGCDLLQGFLFSQPMPISSIEADFR